MEITCPACNKTGQTEAACARCGCDLTRLRAVLKSASAGLSAARDALGRADFSAALEHAEVSWQLRHTSAAARLAFLAAAALHDTPSALSWRRRASATPG